MENYIECQVVMLTTNNEYWNKGDLLLTTININGNAPIPKGTLSIAHTSPPTTHKVQGWYKSQHVHFTSSEEIREGDWYLNWNYNVVDEDFYIDKAGQNIEEKRLKHPVRYKKIIATTDTRLTLDHFNSLPSIPEEWLQKYVAANGKIDNVRLEMTPLNWKWHSAHRYSTYGFTEWIHPRLKLTDKNEVVILDYEDSELEKSKSDWQVIGEDIAKNFIRKEMWKDDEDKELNDVAKEFGKTMATYVGFKKHGAYQSFKAGAQWKEQQMANEAIKFIEWIEKECIIKQGRLMHGLQSVPSSREKLYEIWKTNK